MAASLIKHPWAWVAAIFVIFMIGLSRLYLAVHFPHDVFAGWVLGALALWVFSSWWSVVAAWVKRSRLDSRLGMDGFTRRIYHGCVMHQDKMLL
jgi:undecaprenyl-diphosphatase